MITNRIKQIFLALLPMIVLVGSFGFSVQVDASMMSMQDDHCNPMEMGHEQAEDQNDDHCLRCYEVIASESLSASLVSHGAPVPVDHIACPEQKQHRVHERPCKNHKRQRLREHLSVQPRE
jgi:hypothetical protein